MPEVGKKDAKENQMVLSSVKVKLKVQENDDVVVFVEDPNV